MTTDNFCFYLQNRLMQTSKKGGQKYSDTSPFSISWLVYHKIFEHFALQVDPVIEFIQLGSTPFKDSTPLASKLADPPFWWKSNFTPSIWIQFT